MFIKTPEWMKTSHIFRKNYINPSMMSKAIKKYSHIETEPRTKKKMYRAGKSTSLDSNFFNGSTLNNKEVELKVKTFFPEQGVVDKMVELAEKITDFVMPSDGTLLDNTSDYPIAINMDCYIKNPMKETQIEFLGLEKVPVGSRYEVDFSDSAAVFSKGPSLQKYRPHKDLFFSYTDLIQTQFSLI